jgi:outer membrane protein assembly factor BamA
MSNEHSESTSGHPGLIIVNGVAHTVAEARISYEDVVRLAFPEGPFDITYAVDFATDQGKNGTLTKGQSVNFSVGMTFNVIKSNRS